MHKANEKTTVLVTGGAGYIGSHTVTRLLQKNHRVVVFDNLSTGFAEAVDPRALFVQGDIRDRKLLTQVMGDHKVSSLIHFAAKLNVKESMQAPLEYYDNNVLGLLSTLQAAQETRVQNIVFSSTSNVFGDASSEKLINESAAKLPINPYGRSKLICEEILKDFARISDLKYTILRYFNVAGASLDGTNGQRTRNAYHLIHVAAQAALGKISEVGIYGDDYPTEDGTCVRDYIHIEDIAQIHVLALQRLLNEGTSQDFNCGYGRGYSVAEVLKAMQKVSQNRFSVVRAERRPGDSPWLVSDSTKLKETLGWQAEHDDLEKICRSALVWEQHLSRQNNI